MSMNHEAGRTVKKTGMRGTSEKREAGTNNRLLLPTELKQAVGFHIRRSVNVADAIFADIFNPFNITTQHYAILLTMRKNPGCQPSQLSALLNITPNNLVPRIASLVERGFVRRMDSSNDRRIKHLFLTAEGEEFTSQLAVAHDKVHAQIVDRMGAENAKNLLRLLSLYCDSFSADGPLQE